MAQRALFYPQWGISDPQFLFESLLYWERLVCIVPEPDFKPSAQCDNHLAEAVDELHAKFVSGLAPSDEQRALVHERIGELLDRPPPEWCRPERLDFRDLCQGRLKCHPFAPVEKSPPSG